MNKQEDAYLKAEIALNRFGYGARGDDIKKVSSNPQSWLKAQIAPVEYSESEWTSKHAINALATFKTQRSKEKKNNVIVDKSMTSMEAMNSSDLRKKMSKDAQKLTSDTFHHAIRTHKSFQARLVDFFSNHFSVSQNNIQMRVLAPTLEREAIAPFLDGYFAQMLLAVETHPAMIMYLNNERSAGPNSKMAKRRKNKGLNENLAREILELHTLGVDGGYTQGDVLEFAKAITGWTVGNPRKDENEGFVFKQALHEPGTREVLGKKYSQKDHHQGIKILEDLSIHSSTAKHISYKLARHFIADEPPEKLVNDMTEAWIKSAGHLKTVLTVLIEHPQSYQVAQRKFKTPREFVISACRACGRRSVPKPGSMQTLLLLGQQPFSAGSPAGFKDSADGWDGAEALITRIEWAEHLAGTLDKNPVVLAQNALGPRLNEKTKTFIKRAESREQGTALFLMSPEFQRR